MGKNDIPDRWLPYSPMGTVTPGTRFIACKVPLKEDLLRRLPTHERFGPSDLLDAFPKMGLLVDLTNTTRYYFKQDFTEKRIRYEKIFCPGKVIPPNSIVKKFYDVVDDYLATEEDPDAVIVVHCTHGVNRTGYFICRYMIERLNMSPEEALKHFQSSRGHDIERDSYVSDLKNGCKGGNESDLYFVQNNSGRGRRGGQPQMPHYNKGYRSRDRESNRSYENSAKRPRNDYNHKPYEYNHNKKWGYNGSEFSENWRHHERNQNPHLQSTIPLSHTSHLPPPSHHQRSHKEGSLTNFNTPKPNHVQEHPPVPSYDGARFSKRGHFTGPPKGFRGPPRREFKRNSRERVSPLPRSSHPESSNSSAPSSRMPEGSISNPNNSLYGPTRNQTTTPRFRENSQGRMPSGGRGRGRGRGAFHRGGSGGRRDEKGPQQSKISR